jgi:hypothetical protein
MHVPIAIKFALWNKKLLLGNVYLKEEATHIMEDKEKYIMKQHKNSIKS